jgi:hypothetical protein
MTDPLKVSAQNVMPGSLSGWLTKQSDHIKAWRRMWFVLSGHYIYWFKAPDVTLLSPFSLSNVSTREFPHLFSYSFIFSSPLSPSIPPLSLHILRIHTHTLVLSTQLLLTLPPSFLKAKEAKGVIELETGSTVVEATVKSKSYSFQIFAQSRNNVIVAASQQEMEAWIAAARTAIANRHQLERAKQDNSQSNYFKFLFSSPSPLHFTH